MEKVSIIIPVYNTEKYIEKCLNSVINQNYSNIEILIIDDGSTDKSLQICNKFKEQDKRIEILQTNHQGVSNARNLGIEKSTGKFVIFIDSDDWIENNLIKDAIHIYNEYNVDIVFYDMKVLNNDKNGKKIYSRNTPKGVFSLENIIDYLILSEKFNSPCNKMYKKELIKDIKFDNYITIGEDLLFNINYFKNVKKIYISDKKLYNYIIHKDSTTHTYKENKYNELIKVNNELKSWIINSNMKNKKINNIFNYVRLKNICSCLRDLKNENCKYSKNEKYEYIKNIKEENPKIFVYSAGLKVLIISIIYSLIPIKLLSHIFS